MSIEAKVALYKFVYETEEFDTEEYETLEDAADDMIEESSYDHYGVPAYEVDGMEFAVTDDYSEAEEGAIQWNESVTEECGPGNFWEDYVESGWFEDIQREMNESYAEEIKDDNSSDEDLYVNRLHEELCDFGLMEPLNLDEEPTQGEYDTTEEYDDAYEEWEANSYDTKSRVEDEAANMISELAEKMSEDQGDAVQYYISEFGDEEFNTVVKENNLIDVRAYAEFCVRTDGVSHALAGYDGNEYEVDGFYIYRTN